MSIQKLRNKFSVGAYIKKIAEIWDKVNEIIDYLNGIGSSGDGSYKEYSVNLVQTGTNAPVATVFRNTLGETPLWSYQSPGTYYLTPPSGINISKTQVLVGNEADLVVVYAMTSTEIQLFTKSDIGILSNDMMFNTAFIIRVYN